MFGYKLIKKADFEAKQITVNVTALLKEQIDDKWMMATFSEEELATRVKWRVASLLENEVNNRVKVIFEEDAVDKIAREMIASFDIGPVVDKRVREMFTEYLTKVVR